MFKAFISLGWACVTAASMGKYGLRDGAYPFDWVRSQLNGVLHFLENDFEDFLCREHLSEDGKIFYDRKWGIEFIHDGSIATEGEYGNICEKYKRRIQRFRKTVQEGKVLFVRAIMDQAEVCWVKENSEYISKIINNFQKEFLTFLMRNPVLLFGICYFFFFIKFLIFQQFLLRIICLAIRNKFFICIKGTS